MYIMSQNVLSNHHRPGQLPPKALASIDTQKSQNSENTLKKTVSDATDRFKVRIDSIALWWNCFASVFFLRKPTADQIRLAQLLNEKDDPEIMRKIKQV